MSNEELSVSWPTIFSALAPTNSAIEAPYQNRSDAAFALTVGIATSTAAVLPGVPARQDIFLRIIAAQSRKSRLWVTRMFTKKRQVPLPTVRRRAGESLSEERERRVYDKLPLIIFS